MWKKFRQGELHFSTEYNQTYFGLEKKVSIFMSCDPDVTADGV